MTPDQAASGSSPPTRGAQPCHRRRATTGRIIPAYAGSTVVSFGCSFFACGSSPPTRGAPDRGHARRGHHRIIPAYAGSTTLFGSAAPIWWDHPRLRGEHPKIRVLDLGDGGSSPPTRGARVRSRVVPPGCGIIPAYAGSTPNSSPNHQMTTDHPRLRGEHAGQAGLVQEAKGSSPPTRGAQPACGWRQLRVGIIPAYAGSTRTISHHHARHRDHPRLRGEHELAPSDRVGHCGSSPPTRGALSVCPSRTVASGIIPAYAGSTSTSTSGSHRQTDHPRLRGEHTS